LKRSSFLVGDFHSTGAHFPGITGARSLLKHRSQIFRSRARRRWSHSSSRLRRPYLQCLPQRCIGNWKSDAVALLEGKYRKMAHPRVEKGMLLSCATLVALFSAVFKSVSEFRAQLSGRPVRLSSRFMALR